MCSDGYDIHDVAIVTISGMAQKEPLDLFRADQENCILSILPLALAQFTGRYD